MKVRHILSLCAAFCMTLGLLGACAPAEKNLPMGDDPVEENILTSENFGFQLELPAQGEEVAVMHTSMGDIHIRFFPEQAPKAVENFKTHAKNGYYDGLTFHRVIDSFMIQGGDPTGTGSGGESIWGTDFEDEFDASLGNLRGSLAMANAGVNTNGSQFFINQEGQSGSTVADAREYYNANLATVSAYYDSFEAFLAGQIGLNADALTEEVLSTYEEVGGNYYLDGPLKISGGHTVFGQVYEGMDVVDAIGAVATDDNDKPLEDVVILSIELTTYQG